MGKPWMWHLLRLTKLKEAKAEMDPEVYVAQLQEAHADLMRLGSSGRAVRPRCSAAATGPVR